MYTFESIEDVHEILKNEGIEHEIYEWEDDYKVIYINQGPFGMPAGLKIKKDQFRPEFRISIDDYFLNRVYTKICGATEYMTLEDAISIIKSES